MPAGEVARAEHTRLRRRMLYGLWAPDLQARILDELKSVERADAWGRPDITGNLFAPTCKALAALYCYGPPTVTGPADVVEAVAEAGLWDLQIRGQRDTIGMRELLYRFDPVAGYDGAMGLAVRPVYPDRVVVESRSDAGDVPALVREARILETRPGRWEWAWEVWDARNPTAPERYDTDGSGTVIRRYPWRDTDEYGRAVVPYSLHHAERTGYLFDPREGIEIVEGSMTLGVQWTYFKHLIRNASWPQRYMAGVTYAGGSLEGEDDTNGGNVGGPRRVRIPADPSFVLQLDIPEDSSATPVIGQWAPAADPLKVAEAISIYERRIANLAEIDPSSIQRVSGDPRSGYAISVSSAAAVKAQMRFEPTARRGDLDALRIAAAVLGSARGVKYPGNPKEYTIAYTRPPPDVDPVSGAADAADPADPADDPTPDPAA